MELSPEDKRRIEEEERKRFAEEQYRAQARSDTAGRPQAKGRSKLYLGIILGLAIGAVLTGISLHLMRSISSQTMAPEGLPPLPKSELKVHRMGRVSVRRWKVEIGDAEAQVLSHIRKSDLVSERAEEVPRGSGNLVYFRHYRFPLDEVVGKLTTAANMFFEFEKDDAEVYRVKKIEIVE